MTEADWERILQTVRRRYRVARRNQPPLPFFSMGSSCHDGHLLVVGQDVEPLYLVVILLGPLVAASLSDFFIHRREDFVEVTCWGNPAIEFLWSAAGALPAAAALTKADRTTMVTLIGLIVQEFIDQFKDRQMNT